MDDRVQYEHMAEWWRDHISSLLKAFQKEEEEEERKTDTERMEAEEDSEESCSGFSSILQGQCTIEVI